MSMIGIPHLGQMRGNIFVQFPLFGLLNMFSLYNVLVIDIDCFLEGLCFGVVYY